MKKIQETFRERLLTYALTHGLESSNDGFLNLSGMEFEDEDFEKFMNSEPTLFDKITKLDLSNNKLTKMPKLIEKFRNLEELNLSRNSIQVFKFEKEMLKLITLNLALNDLKFFPDISVKVPNLEQLDLIGNAIEKVGKEHKFENLKNVDLSYNELKEKPQIEVEKIKIKGNPRDSSLSSKILNGLKNAFQAGKSIFSSKASKYAPSLNVNDVNPVVDKAVKTTNNQSNTTIGNLPAIKEEQYKTEIVEHVKIKAKTNVPTNQLKQEEDKVTSL